MGLRAKRAVIVLRSLEERAFGSAAIGDPGSQAPDPGRPAVSLLGTRAAHPLLMICCKGSLGKPPSRSRLLGTRAVPPAWYSSSRGGPGNRP